MNANLDDYKEVKFSKDDNVSSHTIIGVENITFTGFREYYVQGFDRLDIIASEELGDSRLWWVLALVNNIHDPIVDIKRGKKILIPEIV